MYDLEADRLGSMMFVRPDGSFLCADPCRGNMPLVRRTGRARVEEEGSSLLDYARAPIGRLSAEADGCPARE